MNQPKVGISVIIKKEGKVLLGKRKNAHGEGTWSFPGGHLEYEEAWEECAKRETLEEVKIDINNIRFFAATNDIFKKEHKHYITIFMISDYDSGEVKNMEVDKCERWEWFKWSELPTSLFLPIKNLLKNNIKII